MPRSLFPLRSLSPLLLAVIFAVGCGRSTPTGPVETPLAGHGGLALLWEPKNDTQKPIPMIVLSAEGTEPHFWDLLASTAANEGYRVLVCPASAHGGAETMLGAARDALGNPVPVDCVVVTETGPADEVLAIAANGTPLGALAFLSPTLSGAAEDQVKRLDGTPLLLAACENDTQGIAAAYALKAAATGYCEIQTYACGVRGVDILAVAPSLAGQVLAWLKPIMMTAPKS